jgi:acyl-CoA thioester hydrolase
MSLHVDMDDKRTAPLPADIAERLAGLKAAHDALPRPDGLGRRIAMSGKS